MFTRSTTPFALARRVLLAGLFTTAALLPLGAHGFDPPPSDRWHDDGRGAVLALTNDPSANAVVVYRRGPDGALRLAGSYATGGRGSGAGLMSQGAVVVSDDRRFVLAVNAGSHSISVFRVRADRLQLVDTAPTGGTTPTSLAVRNGLVAVLNAGEPNGVTGFFMGPLGRLYRLPGFSRPLSTAQASPGQVGFSDDGDTLIVTERATNQIATFAIDGFELDGPYLTPSAGPTPYGFAVGSRNRVLVSEAGTGGGASTYRVVRDRLTPISSAIMTGQRAACWAVLTPNGRFGYVSNAGTGTITGFAIDRDGSATQLNADGVTGRVDGNPTDMALSDDGRYLYARVGAANAIAAFAIGRDGALRPLGVTATASGLAGLAGF